MYWFPVLFDKINTFWQVVMSLLIFIPILSNIFKKMFVTLMSEEDIIEPGGLRWRPKHFEGFKLKVFCNQQFEATKVFNTENIAKKTTKFGLVLIKFETY